MTSWLGLALSQATAASRTFRSDGCTWIWPDAKCTSCRFSRAANSVMGSGAGEGPVASGADGAGTGAASGHSGAAAGGAVAAAVTGVLGWTCFAQPSGASTRAREPSARATRASGVMATGLVSGQLMALAQAIVQHAEAELELGRKRLELIEPIAVGTQAAVLQQPPVPQHRETQQTRLGEQPLDVIHQHILGLRHAPLLL